MPNPPTNPVPAAEKMCGALDCDEREAVPQQMKLIPRGNKKPRHPGALHYHFKRSSCRHYIEGTTPRKPGRQPRLMATELGPSRIPVGAMIRDDPCPQIIAQTDRDCFTRRTCNLSAMTPEQREMPLPSR